MKVCKTCQKSKPTNEFGKSRTNKDGFNSECKSCYNLATKAKRQSLKKANNCLICSSDITLLNATARVCHTKECQDSLIEWNKTKCMMELAANDAFSQSVAYRKQVEYSNFLADDFLDTDEFYSGLSSFMQNNSSAAGI